MLLNSFKNYSDRRSDIDILRAVAVLGVVLFHFDAPGLGGGFLGVDVFFVISGYLISGHILRDVEQREFSFYTFYLRRIRRLAPVYIVVILFTSIGSLFFLPLELLKDFSKSLVASSLYVSNVLFWFVSDYFDTGNYVKPLLHTWSLSVEEQFYLFWPLLLVLVGNRKRFLTWLVLLSLLSLFFAQYYVRDYPSLVYYWFPFRIFEFGIGALVCRLSFANLQEPVKYTLIPLSVFVIVISFFITESTTLMPGLLSLPVCIATAIIIWLRPTMARENILVVLFSRIGLISYSAYLVHWPLVVFYKLKFGNDLQWLEIVVLVITTFFLAEVLYRFVERPSLKYKINTNLSKVLLLVLVPIVTSFGVIYSVFSTTLYASINSNSSAIFNVIDRTPSTKEIIDLYRARTVEYEESEAEFRIVILGDSHSRDLFYTLTHYLDPNTYAITLLNSVCDPLTENSLNGLSLITLYQTHSNPQATPKRCAEYHKSLRHSVELLEPSLIVFSERWRSVTIPYLEGTIQDLKRSTSANVLVLGSNFEYITNPGPLYRQLEDGENLNSFMRGYFNTKSNQDSRLIDVVNSTKSAFLSKLNLVCPAGECQAVYQGMLTYSDGNHWSPAGHKLFGQRLVNSREFQSLLKRNWFYDGSKNYISLVNEISIENSIEKLFVPSTMSEMYRFYKGQYVQSDKAIDFYIVGDKTTRYVYTMLKDYDPALNLKHEESECFNSQILEFVGLVQKESGCKNTRKLISSGFWKGGKQHIVIASTFGDVDFSKLKEFIRIAISEGNVVTVLEQMPRFFPDSKKASFFSGINRKVRELESLGIRVYSFSDQMCRSIEDVECFSSWSANYDAPNLLSVEGARYFAPSLFQFLNGVKVND